MQYMFWLGREGERATGGFVPKGKMYLVGDGEKGGYKFAFPCGMSAKDLFRHIDKTAE